MMITMPDAPPEPARYSTVVDIIEHHADWVPGSSLKGLLRNGIYIAGNSLTMSSVVTDVVTANYKPRTELGRRLVALRHAYLSKGGRLLSADALEEEVRSRRGGVESA